MIEGAILKTGKFAGSSMNKTKVLLIAGAAHGGTTITSILLGQHPQLFVTSKMRGFARGDRFDENNFCSCGERTVECSFWREVRERFKSVQETRDLDRLTRLYRILSDVSARPYVVDVTHNPADVERFLGPTELDFRLLHVYRDLEAVVYSRLRKDYQIGRVKESGPIRLFRVAKVARHWKRQRRRFLQAERSLDGRALRVDYQQLCQEPHGILEQVGSFMDVDFSEVCDDLLLGEPLGQPFHFIRGNIKLRSKHQEQKQIRLRYDDSYLTEMPPIERLLSRVCGRLS